MVINPPIGWTCPYNAAASPPFHRVDDLISFLSTHGRLDTTLLGLTAFRLVELFFCHFPAGQQTYGWISAGRSQMTTAGESLLRDFVAPFVFIVTCSA